MYFIHYAENTYMLANVGLLAFYNVCKYLHVSFKIDLDSFKIYASIESSIWSNGMSDKEKKKKSKSNRMFLGLYLYDELADHFVLSYRDAAKKSKRYLPMSAFVRNILRMYLEDNK